jgi:hypothetical protein
MLVKAAVAVAAVALVQAPVRVAADVLILRHCRHSCPQLFDGPACAAAVAACLDEYQRELDLDPLACLLKAARAGPSSATATGPFANDAR